PRDPRLMLERETLKLLVQHPQVAGPHATELDPADFTHGAYRALWATMGEVATAAAADTQWASRLREQQRDDRLRVLVSALATEPLHSEKDPDDAYVVQHVYRLRELTTLRRIADVKSRLQRTNPVTEATDYNKMFGELIALEQHRRSLREKALESQ
ncbi:MAG: primase, partial [Marmoricola sp.]|nr:primase [Marmoricola sp.]